MLHTKKNIFLPEAYIFLTTLATLATLIYYIENKIYIKTTKNKSVATCSYFILHKTTTYIQSYISGYTLFFYCAYS